MWLEAAGGLCGLVAMLWTWAFFPQVQWRAVEEFPPSEGSHMYHGILESLLFPPGRCIEIGSEGSQSTNGGTGKAVMTVVWRR